MTANPLDVGTDMITLNDLTIADIEQVILINNEALPAVSMLDTPRTVSLLSQSAAAVGAFTLSNLLLGFIILLPEGADYDSANYAWVSEHHDRFVYIDRVVVWAEARGLGIGKRLYEKAKETAAMSRSPLIAEVNSAPPNPDSLRFHKREGFAVIGQHQHHSKYAVDFLRWNADAAP